MESINWKEGAAVLSELRKAIETSAPPLVENIVGVQAINGPAEEEIDPLDSYIAECATCVARETGLSEDEALDHVFWLAEAGEEAGALPSLPAVDATQEEINSWLNAAEATEFVEKAVGTAFDSTEG